MFVGAGHLRAERSGIAEAHRAEAERADVAPGLVETVELCGPHLVLADTGRDDRVALGEFVENFYRLLGNDVFTLLVAERVILHPRRDLGVPRLVVGRSELRGEFVEAGEGVFDVARDRELDALVLVVLGSVDVDVDDLGGNGEFIGVAGDAVVEACGEAEEQVALIDGPVAVGGAMHAEPVHGKRMGFGKSADAHEGGGDRDIYFLGEGFEFGAGLGRNDTAANVEHGFFRGRDQGEDFLELLVARARDVTERRITKLDRGGENGLELRLLNILRNINDDRAGATAAGQVEGLFEDARQVVHVHHEIGVFHDRQRHAVEVGFLERHLADVF